MVRGSGLILLLSSLSSGSAQAARLTLDDQASISPRTASRETIDFTNRTAKAFSALSPDCDAAYVMRGLEDATSIGNPGALRLEEMVKACVSLKKDAAPE